jgi:hypothetical protein
MTPAKEGADPEVPPTAAKLDEDSVALSHEPW